jgi:alkanesulfonate monooxygenase SsuD/methylene tetrahydromethanopterin reductase-like flavin-dependent oxidoreductase (luciferase family)
MVRFGVHPAIDRSTSRKSLSNLLQFLDSSAFESFFLSDSLSNDYDTLALLSFISSLTSRIKIGTCVFILPLRHPAFVAKQTSSIQRYSGNRFIFGTGVGWRKSEFDLLGVDFTKRGKIMDEAIKFIQEAWSNDSFSFHGSYFTAEGLQLNSSLSVKPPLWIGGNSTKALERAIQLGDGWIPTDLTVEEYLSLSENVKKLISDNNKFVSGLHIFLILSEERSKADTQAEILASRFGENKETFKEYSLVGNPSDVVKRINEYCQAGVNYFVLSLTYLSLKNVYKTLKMFARDVIPSF